MKNYFDFIMFLALETVLIYENKRSITLEQLHKYRIRLCEKNRDYHSQFTEYSSEEFEQDINFFHSSNLNMSKEEEMECFRRFLDDNSIYFFYKNGSIYVRDGVTFSDIDDSKFDLSSYENPHDKIICGELIWNYDCVELLDILGLTKIKKFVQKIVEDEKKIESAYRILSGVELEEFIKALSDSIDYKLALIGNLSDDKSRCYHRVIKSLGEEDNSHDNQEIQLFSEQTINQLDSYGIDSSIIESILNSAHQRAIFKNNSLACTRLDKTMDAIWYYRNPDAKMEYELIDPEAAYQQMEEDNQDLDDENDDYDEEYEDEEFDENINQIDSYLKRKTINMAFYLNYIANIRKYQQTVGLDNSLEDSKRRLIYLLDVYGESLYKEENFQQALSSINMREINASKDLDDFYLLSTAFLVEALEEEKSDDLIAQKMLFASTYYALTKDKRIEEILRRNGTASNSDNVSDIILNSNYEKISQLIPSDAKKIVKKSKDSN